MSEAGFGRIVNMASRAALGKEMRTAQRMGTPADIAHTATYLLHAQAGFVTGQTIYVCGGLTVGVSPL